MKRIRWLTLALTIISGVFTAIGAILGNLASNQIPANAPFLRYVWWAFAIVTTLGIGINLWFVRVQQEPVSPLQTRDRKNRERLIERVRTFWIEDVLEQSLYNASLIVLNLNTQPSAVASPWRLEWQLPNQTSRPLPPGTRIMEVYRQAAGELLILGEPGSGKTTLLLELARDLISPAAQDEAQPMPVIFSLSSWAEKRLPLTDWLVEELFKRYRVPRKVGQDWIKRDQILPLLDGLDEVAEIHRYSCVQAINAYHQEHLLPLVVCARRKEYDELPGLLMLQKAIVIQPLTPKQVDDYLASGGKQLAVVRVALRKDTVLQEVATTPLMLVIFSIAYQDKQIDDLPVTHTVETQREQVFAAYVECMLVRPRSGWRYSAPKMKAWLVWLAYQMKMHNLSIFYLEDLQPDWLIGRWIQRFYVISLSLILLVVFFPMGWLIFADVFVKFLGAIGIIAGGLVSFCLYLWAGIGDARSKIELAERMNWSRINLKSLQNDLILYLFLGLLVGVILGVLGGLLYGLLAGITVILITFFSVQLPQVEIDKSSRVKPNQGIWYSMRNGLYFGLCFGVIVIILYRLAGQFSGQFSGLIIGLLMFSSILVGLTTVGIAFIQHMVLRMLLLFMGNMPLWYIQFLNAATDRLFLRNTGGGYIFIHRLLLEYFASLSTKSP